MIRVIVLHVTADANLFSLGVRTTATIEAEIVTLILVRNFCKSCDPVNIIILDRCK